MKPSQHIKSNTAQAVHNKSAAAMNGKEALPVPDNRAATTMQRKQLDGMNNNHGIAIPIQKKENNTGLPDNLKSGVENLSGISMDDVKVHYNSAQPKQLQAHAYAQGTDIHVAPGQEKHLPHEAWHVVQQKQGRVKPTMQLKSKVNINNDKGLENEADHMGAKALQTKEIPGNTSIHTAQLAAYGQTVQAMLSSGVIQMEGGEWLNALWGFIKSAQNFRGSDSIARLIELAGTITSGVATLTKDHNTGVAGASIKLITDTGVLISKYNKYRDISKGNDPEETQKAWQDLIVSGITVLSDIVSVIIATYSGPAAGFVAVAISVAVSKLITAIWGDVKGYNRDGEHQKLMGSNV